MKQKAKIILRILTLFLVIISVFNRVDVNKVGIAKNHFTGVLYVQNPGMHFRLPWVWVTQIPTNPIRVSIPTSGRGFSSRLVQFEPEHFQEFVQREGWRFYWWDNRFSFNFGNQEEYRGFRNIALGYAYADDEYPFFKRLSSL